MWRSLMFDNMMPDDCSSIADAGQARRFGAGEMLYMEGDSVQRVMLLTTGIVKITKFGISGVEVILRLGVRGDVLGGVDLISTSKHGATAQALRPCHVLTWDAATFRSLVRRFPALRENMLRLLTECVSELEERFREMASERVGQRVARQLVRLATQIGRPVEGAIEVGLSREQLAQMTGTTLFTVSRLLSGWESQGLLKPRREAVLLCDIEALRNLSETST
jgi:CRP-like cAMP-binding protein